MLLDCLKANFLKFGQHVPIDGVVVLRGTGILGGWSWHSMSANWDDSYNSTYTPAQLITEATAVEAYFWPYGVEALQIKLVFHESNTWEGDPNFGTLGAGDMKSLEVGLPDDWVAPEEPSWWSSIWWNPEILESHF